MASLKNGIEELFNSGEAWTGGHYELAMELGPYSDVRALGALRRLWTCPLLEGGYLRRDQTPVSQVRRPSQEGHLDEQLYGIATLEGRKMPCGSFLYRLERGSDWLQFYLPFAPLEQAYSIDGYPFTGNADYPEWRRTLDSWFRRIGDYVFEQTPFFLGLVGFEVEITKTSYREVLKDGIPKFRPDGMLLPKENALEWYPPTPM